jgi:hypothetical protein
MTPSGAPPSDFSVTEKSRSTVATPPTSFRLEGDRPVSIADPRVHVKIVF